MATTSYYHYDAIGSTQLLTDESEAVTDSYEYDGYGNELAASGTTVNPFRYVGELGYYFDSDTGDYYVRARYYDPVTARWLSEDPIGYDSGSHNSYEYGDSTPLNRIDPAGLLPACCTFDDGNTIWSETIDCNSLTPSRCCCDERPKVPLLYARWGACHKPPWNPPPHGRCPKGCKPVGSGRTRSCVPAWPKWDLKNIGVCYALITRCNKDDDVVACHLGCEWCYKKHLTLCKRHPTPSTCNTAAGVVKSACYTACDNA